MPTDPIRMVNKFIYCHTFTVAAGAAVALTAAELSTTLVQVQADPDNGAAVMIGNVDAQPWQLNAGDTITLNISAPARIYVRAAAGTQRVNWLALGL